MQGKLAEFALSVLKVMLFLKAFIGKTFAIHPKICENCKAFLLRSFNLSFMVHIGLWLKLSKELTTYVPAHCSHKYVNYVHMYVATV